MDIFFRSSLDELGCSFESEWQEKIKNEIERRKIQVGIYDYNKVHNEHLFQPKDERSLIQAILPAKFNTMRNSSTNGTRKVSLFSQQQFPVSKPNLVYLFQVTKLLIILLNNVHACILRLQ